MKRYIKCNSNTDVIERIMSFVEKRDVYSVKRELSLLPDNTAIKISINPKGESGFQHYIKQGSHWDDVDGTFSYSSYDIADELINGRYNYLVDLVQLTKKYEPHISERNKPAMWRK